MMLCQRIVYNNGLVGGLDAAVSFGQVQCEGQFAGLEIAGTCLLFGKLDGRVAFRIYFQTVIGKVFLETFRISGRHLDIGKITGHFHICFLLVFN